MSTAQRQATRRYRERRRKSGLTRLEVQVPAEAVPVIRKAASLLRDQTEGAAGLRRHLGFEESAPIQSALGIFAMNDGPYPKTLWNDAMAQVRRERRDPRHNRARRIKL
jgi:hypothetical protein